MKYRIITPLLLSLLAAASIHAQTAPQPPLAPQSAFKPIDGTVACFDTYHFGSVQAHLVTPTSQAASGAPLTFTGTIDNQNDTPIVDAALYVKVFRKGAGTSNGADDVDEFWAASGLAIPARSSVPASFSWNVPAYALSGDYYLATYITVAHKFNLLGLSFTDDVAGNTVPFHVVGEMTKATKFERATVTVDAKPYQFAAYPPRLSATKPVTIAATIRNAAQDDVRASLTWSVYYWDAQLRENSVQEETKPVVLKAGASTPASVTVRDTRYPVYLVVGTLTAHGAKSIINVRFIRDDIDRLRLNFPTVVKYPLVAGEKNSLISCVHNAGQSAFVQDGKLELRITDLEGNTIYAHTFAGSITSAMMGLASDFVPAKDYSSFNVEARLYHAGEFVDEAHLEYRCEQLHVSCTAPPLATPLRPASKPMIPGGLGAVLIIPLLLLVVLFWRLFHY